MLSAPQRCAACYRRLPVNPIYCRSCATIAFCSAACRVGAATDACHAPGGPECGVPWPGLLPNDVRLALRLASRLVIICRPQAPNDIAAGPSLYPIARRNKHESN